ncbi:RNA polymerase II elongation factor ELL2 isoform X1 [Hippocampus comes]|uniref:RNA polymerase II elongation factor ELL2 isoform X1 n=1 Tax=Hippocampus comes TaxID=109280 RepID=UPI00094ED324|nr:PREDICTED: RNA polymerase II elongation factor ELL2-like isoform X1 [Hippocampus comes]
MASLGQERSYGLSCGKNNNNNSSNKHGPNRTLYHVKLTDTAFRALEAYQNLKANLPSEPSICFEGSQGYIKLPAPTAESPNALRVFSFYLSSDCKDQPQASFDCIHQYVSSDGREQLEGQGVIQDKITVCATEDSYQMTRERMSQVEKDSWSRSAIEIKPGATHPSKSVKIHKRPPIASASDSSFCKPPAPSRWSGSMASLHQKPLKERIIHLLALKSYRKPELLLWLERERVGPKDKTELGAILEEVAKVNPKDSSYLLKEDFYKYVRRDWPGYSEEERQLVNRLLSRKLPPHVHGHWRNPQANESIVKPSEDRMLMHHSLTKNPVVKRPVPTDSLLALAAKRQRQIDQRTQPQPFMNGLLNNKGAPITDPLTFHTKPDFQGTNNTIGSNVSDHQHGSPGEHKMLSTPNVSETDQHKTKALCRDPPRADLECPQQQRKKKSKKHKDKERERLKDHQDKKWSEGSPDLKHEQDKLENCDITNGLDLAEKPDYVNMYVRITSVEQRQRYQEDFSAEYDEYKDLHTRIATITHMFVQLASKIKSMSPGTKEHKVMEDQILEKYNKYRKKFPDYQEEKKRCEYLHQKLSFIKQLIEDYDVSRTSS